MNVRQDGADQEAKEIAVQRASDRQISLSLHRISAQTMSMPLNTNKVIPFWHAGPFFSLFTFAIFHPL